MIALGIGLLLHLTAAAVNPIIVKGNAFFDSVTGDRFYVRGVDYQPDPDQLKDPLSDSSNCARDIPYFKDLGINAIRSYTVDNSLSHDNCMQQLNDAGIYLILDVNTPKQSISRANPMGTYTAGYLQNVFATIDAFKKYDNLLGFIGGNEVVNEQSVSGTATVVKAVMRDMKQYIGKQAGRPIPVGYAAADISSNVVPLAEYFNCGADNERSEFYSMNSYSWCGSDSSYTISGYDQKVASFSNCKEHPASPANEDSLPLFFAEYGCNQVMPRVFDEIGALFSTQMTPVFSGGLIYEFTQQTNNYGLVDVSSGSVKTLQDYTNLKSQLSKNPSPTGTGGGKTSGTPSNCDPAASMVGASSDLPALPSAASAYMDNGAGPPSGLNGGGGGGGSQPSQARTTTSSQTVTSAASAAATTSKAAAPAVHSSISLTLVSVACVCIAGGMMMM